MRQNRFWLSCFCASVIMVSIVSYTNIFGDWRSCFTVSRGKIKRGVLCIIIVLLPVLFTLLGGIDHIRLDYNIHTKKATSEM